MARRILHVRQSAGSVASMTCAQALQRLTPEEVQTYFEVQWYAEGQAHPNYMTALPTLIVATPGQQPLSYGGNKCIEAVNAIVGQILKQRPSMEMRHRPPVPQVPGVHTPVMQPAMQPQQGYERPVVTPGMLLPKDAKTYEKQYMPPPGVIAAGDTGARGGARGVPLEMGQLENGGYAWRPKNAGLTQRIGDLTHGAREGGQSDGFLPSGTEKYDIAAEIAKHSAHQKAVWEARN